jgi:hypothetical protein
MARCQNFHPFSNRRCDDEATRTEPDDDTGEAVNVCDDCAASLDPIIAYWNALQTPDP